MTTALHFTHAIHHDSQVTGIRVAVDGIVDAFLRYAAQDKMWCVAPEEELFQFFVEKAVHAGRSADSCIHLTDTQAKEFSKVSCLLKPEPSIAHMAWNRRQGSQRAYSLCGVSHTMSTSNVMKAVGDCITNPLQSWDAIICPSMAIRDSIHSLWNGWREYLGQRFDSRIRCPIQTPVIPLGIDCQKFSKNRDPILRVKQREILGVSKDQVVVLFLGRLSYFAKAHPLPLFLAAEQAAKETGKQIHLVFYGYFQSEKFETEFRDAASSFCEKAMVSFVLNTESEFTEGVWAAADIFVSPSDNIQESFGLTPIEAMASGLPVIISDWDGYRDAISHGVEGFLIPTLMPAPGNGVDQAHRYLSEEDNYGEYLAGVSQSTAVDVRALVSALVTLIENKSLRQSMGNAGILRAESRYDWKQVIPQYDALFAELAERRKVDPESAERKVGSSAFPLKPDPFQMFEGFSSATLSWDDQLELSQGSPNALTRLIKHRMNYFAPTLLVPPKELPTVLYVIKNNPGITLADLSKKLGNSTKAQVMRTASWLIKLGILERR
ncbi:MAG: glycosyltransferase [Pseudomonadota bacterium]|nr:glycosyltransferase [Pseudomonadota bacterium]